MASMGNDPIHCQQHMGEAHVERRIASVDWTLTRQQRMLHPGDEWGFTGLFDRDNGGGFLTEHFPGAAKAVWHFEGIYASSRHIPGTFLKYLS